MNSNSGSSTPVIGEVTAATGKVIVIKPDGTQKILEEGSKVYFQDRVLTENGGSVVITTVNNQLLELGGQQQLILVDSMLNSAWENSEEELSLEEIQTAIAAGVDPTSLGEATASGDEQRPSDDSSKTPETVESNPIDMPVIEREGAVEEESQRTVLSNDQIEDEGDLVPVSTLNRPEEEQEEEFEQDSSDEVVVTSYQPVAQSSKMVGSDDGSVLQGQLYATDNNAGESMSYSLVSSPEVGSLSVATDGSFEFNPGSDFEYLAVGESKTVSFVFEVTDSQGNRSRASVDINIEGTNDTPEVEDPVTLAVSQEDDSLSLNLLHNASDADLTDQLSVTNLRLVSGNEAGVSIGVDGTELVIDPDAYSFLAEGESETITYEYRVTDSQGDYTTQTASITLAGSNDLPVVEDVIVLNADQRSPLLDIDLLDGATDIDASDTLNVVKLRLTAGDPVGVRVSDDGNHLTVDSKLYDHLAEGETETLEFSYDVDDGHGETVSQTASITIEGRNDAPEDILLSNNVIDENASGIVVGALSTIDIDRSDSHTYAIDDNRFEVVSDQLRLKSGISLDHETEASVTVNVTTTDNNGATFTETFTIDVNDINETPETIASSTTIQEDSLYRFSLTDFPYSDVDDGDRLESVFIDTLPAKGIVELNGLAISAGAEISRADIEAGNLTFLPDAHESADDYASFQFRVNDGELTSSAQSFTINVTPVVDAANLSLNGPETVTTLGFENGMGDWTSVNGLESHGSGVMGDPHGGSRLAELDNAAGGVPDEYSYNVDTSLGHDHQLTLWLRQRDNYDSTDDVEIVWNGEVVATFDPEKSWGEFTVTLPHVDQVSTQVQIREVASQNNGSGPIVDDISVVRMAAENSADPAYDYSISSFEDTFVPLILNQSLVDMDGSESIVLSLSGIPANSTLTDGSNTITTDGSDIDISSWQHNLLRMSPPENSNTDFVLTFTTTTTESATGESVSVARTLHVDLIPVNDAAIISGEDTGDVTEDSAATLSTSGTLTITDVDTGEENFQAETQTGSHGQLVIDTAGNWVYTADNSQGAIQNLGVSETLTDSFIVRAKDGTEHTVTATIQGTNDAPVLTAGGTISYIENDGDQVVDAHITLADIDSAAIDTASIVISDNYVSGEDSLSFTDHNGISGSWDSASGTLTLTGTATVAQYQEALRTVTYNNSSDSPDTTDRIISFSINDGHDTSNIATSTITITAVNDAPETVNASAIIDEDTPYIFSSSDFAYSDVDAGDEFEGIQIATLPTAGALLFNGSTATPGQNISKQDLLAGRLKFEPELNANGNQYASFDFKVSDGELLSNAASFEVNVTPVNDTPIASGNISQSTSEDISITVTEAELLAKASDIDGDALSVSNLRVSSGQVSVTDNGDSTWTITPGSDWSGSAAVQFDITDGAVVITSQIDMTVDAVADEPVLTLGGNTIGNAVFSGSNTELINDDSGPHTFSGSAGDELAYSNTGISPSANDMTVSFWMRWDGNNNVMPVSFGQYGIWIYNSSIGFNNWASNIYGSKLNDLQLAEGSSGLVNEWHHIVATFNDGNASRNTLRIDGITQDLSDVGPLSTSPSSNANIHQTLYFGGGYTNAESFQLRGSLDGIKVYEGTMTDAEALSLYELEAADTNYHPGIASAAPEIAGIEDTDITLDLGSSLSDTDGSESLATSLGGIPSGFILTDGSNTVTSDGSDIDVTGWSLNSLTLSPAANYNADFTIVVTATSTESDGGDTSQITRDIHIQMQAVNDAAVITGDDSGAITEDASSTLSVSGVLSVSDVDVGENLFSAETVTGSYGALTIDANGNWTYTADNTQNSIQSLDDGETLTETLSVQSVDGATHSVVITINGTNDAPVIDAGILDQSATEEAAFSFQIPGNAFSDIEGESLTYTASLSDDSVLPGWLNFDAASGTFSGTPDDPDLGQITVKVTASDGDLTVSETFNVDVAAVNDAPDSANETVSLQEDSSYTFLSADFNFTDVDSGDSLSQVRVETLPATGVLQLNGVAVVASDSIAKADIDAGHLTFIPAPDANGTNYASFRFSVADASGTFSLSDYVMSMDVTAVNDAPVVSASISESANEDVSLTMSEAELLATASDSEGDTLSVSNVQVTSGNVSVTDNGDATWTITPAANWSGSSQISFDVSDGLETISNVLNLAVDARADLPITTVNGEDEEIFIQSAEDTAIPLNINVALADNDGSETLDLKMDQVPAGAVLTDGVNTVTSDGSRIDINGWDLANIALTPPANEENDFSVYIIPAATESSNGDSVSLPYHIRIDIQPRNDAAVIGGVDTGTVTEDDFNSHGSLGEEELIADGTLTISDIDNQAGFVAETINGSYGELTININGQWQYIADSRSSSIQALGVTETLDDTITVQAVDGTTHDITVTIQGANDQGDGAPVFLGTLAEDNSLIINESSILNAVTDIDGDTLTLTNIQLPVGGHSIVNNNDGTWTLTPAQDFNGMLEMLYVVSDGTQGFEVNNLVRVNITVVADTAVISGDDSASVTEDAAATLTASGMLSVVDPDAGEEGFNAETVTGIYGNLTIDADGNWSYSADNSQSVIQSLDDGDVIQDVLTVQAIDGTTQTVTISITGTNDSPVLSSAINDQTVAEDTAFSYQVPADAFNDAEGESLTYSATLADGSPLPAWLGFDADTRTFSGTPVNDDVGNLVITVKASDGQAEVSADFTITVANVNDSAVITGVHSGSVTEDSASTLVASGKLDIADDDIGETSFNTETLTGSYGSLSIDASGNWSYSADNTQIAIQSLGSGDILTDVFTVQSVDGTTATVTITLSGTDDAAVISGVNSASVTEDALAALTTSGALVVSDVDNGEASFAAETITGSYGTLSIDVTGNWSYSADNSQPAIQSLSDGDQLTDTITVQALDGTTQNIVITITGTNDAAVIGGVNTASVTEDAAAALTASGALTISDTDTGEAYFTAETIAGSYGSLTIDASGNWSYSADNTRSVVQSLGNGDSLTETISVRSLDGTTQNIVITITGTNDTAIIGGVDAASITEDAAATLTASGALNISDTDTSENIFNAETITGSYGSLTIDAAGNWSYSADNTQSAIQQLAEGDSIADVITVSSFDGTTHQVTIAINGTDDAAVIGGTDSAALTEDAAATLTASGALTISDTDSDESSFTAETVTGSYGSLTIDASGNWNYSADNSQSVIQSLGDGDQLIDTINVQAPDGTTQNIVITITGTNDAAVIGGVNTASVTEDAAAALTASGALTISDTDTGEAYFTAETIAGSYGSLTIDASGNWSYSADSTQSVVQSLGNGDALTETIRVRSLDGTPQNVLITITGTNDAAVIGGVDTASITEDAAATLTAIGALTISDTDTGENTFNAETITGSYGSLTIDAAGNWSYSADNTQSAIQQLAEGDSIADVITVSSFDGTTHRVTITINGTNDAAVIGGTDSAALTEDNATTLAASGSLTISDTDSGELSFTAETITGSFGSLTIDASGNWNYSADNSQSAIQSLADGDQLTDTITVQALDGTTQNITITITGTNDTTVIGGVDTASITEDAAATLTTSGTLTIIDTDTGENTFNAETITGSYGSLTIDASGNWSYSADNTQSAIQQLAEGDSIADVITVSSFDGTMHQVTITINGTNDAAVIGGTDSATLTEDAVAFLSASGSITISDTDSGESSFTAETITGSYGSLTIDASGNWSYSADNSQSSIQQLAEGDSIADVITVSSFDGTTHQVTITINGTNDAAVIGGTDSAALTEDNAATLAASGSLTISDTDSGESSFTAETITGSYGSLTIDASGNWNYSADNSQSAIQSLGDGDQLTDKITVQALDGTTKNIAITITGTNDAAVIGGTGSAALTEDNAATLAASGSLTISDTDSGESSFTAETVTGSYGSLTIDASGNWNYSADNSQSAIQSLSEGDQLTDTITVQALDGTTQNIVITIAGTNDTAVIDGVDTASIAEDAAAVLTANGALTISDTDIGENTFNAETITGSYGSLTIDAAGNWSYSADNSQSSIQQLAEGDSIADVITVSSFDGTMHQVTITINGTNDAAVIGGTNSAVLTEDAAASLSASGSLTISDTDSGESSFTAETVTGSYGSLTIDASGNWNYSADNSQSAIQSLSEGDQLTDTITVQALDGTTQNIVITIAGTNDTAVIDGVDTASIAEDAAAVLTANGALTISDTDIGENTFNAETITGSYGSLTIDAAGNWSYSADNSQSSIQQLAEGDSIADVITVSSFDGTMHQVTITINGTNDAAVIGGTNSAVLTEDAAASLSASGSLTISDTDSGESSFTAETVTGSYGSLTIDASGNWNYSADNSQSAIQSLSEGDQLTDTITVQALDGTTQNIVITIAGTNDTAVIDGVDTASIAEDAAAVLTANGALTISDTDIGENTFNAETITGSYGSLTIDAAGNWSYSADNSQSSIQQLAEGDSIADVITVSSFDGTMHQVTITINGTNDAAVIGGTDSAALTEDAAATLTASGALTISDTDSGESSFTVETVTGSYGSLNIDASGNWNYSADNSQSAIQFLADGDQLTDTITAQALDGTTQNITITITGTNDAAVTGGVNTASVTEDAAAMLTASGALTISDTDTGEAQFTAETITGSYGSLTIDASGNWSYSADNTQSAIQSLGNGDALTETISVRSLDGTTQNVLITINGTNDAPTISSAINKTTNEDTSFTISEAELLANASDVEGEALSVSNVTVSGGGMRVVDNGDGTWTVSPDTNWSGAGQLAFDVSDGTATVSDLANITVTPDADAPVINPASSAVVTAMDFESNSLAVGWTSTNTPEINRASAYGVSDSNGGNGYIMELDEGPGGSVDAIQYTVDTGTGFDHELEFAVRACPGSGNTDTIEVVWNGTVIQTIDPGNSWQTITITLPSDGSDTGQLELRELSSQNNGTGALIDNLSIRGVNSITFNEDSSASFEVAADLTDTDGSESITSVSVAGVPSGYVIGDGVNTVTADGSDIEISSWDMSQLTLTPTSNTTGTVSVTVSATATESGGDTSTTQQTIEFNIQSVADAAIIGGDDTGSVQEDAAATLTASGALTITDPDAGEAFFSAETINGTYGSVTIDASGSWSYSADNTQNAIQSLGDSESLTDVFSVSSLDGTTHNVVITINGQNDIASSSDQLITLDEDSTYTFSASDFSFSDADSSDSLQSVTITQLPANGNLQLGDTDVNANDIIALADIGNLTFSPTANANGDDYASLQFTVSDGMASSSNQTLTFDVTAVNDAPTTPELNEFDFIWGGASMGGKTADTYTLPSDFNFGDTIWIYKSDNLHKKAVELEISDNGDGSLNFKAVAAAYTTLTNWNSLTTEQQDTFFADGRGSSNSVATSDSANGYGIRDVALNGGTPVSGFLDSTGKDVHPFITVENSANGTVVGTVAATDLDGDAITYSLTDNAGGRFAINSSSGEITVADGSLLNFEDAASHTITVEVSDGQLTSSRNYSISLQDMNDAPELLSALDDQTTAEEAAFSYTLPTNAFADQDGDAITFSATLPNGDPLPAWLSFDAATRTFSGTPDDPDIGTVSVRIVLSDGVETTDVFWSVEVTAVNDATEATDDTNTGEATVEGAAISGSGSVLDNDTDVENDPLTVVDVNGTSISGSTIIGGDFGDLTIGADGNWTYTPGSLDLQTDLVGHWTLDGNTLDSAPTDSVADNGTLQGGATISGGGLHGSSLNLSSEGGGLYIGPSVEMDELAFANRTVSFAFRIDESNPLNSRQVLFDEGGIIRGLNAYIDNGKLYIGGYDNSIGWDGTWYSIDLPSDNDYHSLAWTLGSNKLTAYLDGDAFTTVVSDVHTGTKEMSSTHQELSFGARYGDTVYHDGTVDVSDTPTAQTFIGELDEIRVYNRTLNHQEVNALDYEFKSQALQDIFTYTVSDGDKTDTATLTIDVNRVPEAISGTLSITEDSGEIVGQLSAIDRDAGDSLTFSVESQPAEGSVVVNANGSYSFNPGADFQDLVDGESRDVTFDYRVTDTQGDSTTATVTVTVNGVSDAATLTSVETYTEDFEGLAAGNLDGQDGWVTEKSSSIDMTVADNRHDGSTGLTFNQSSANASASKLNTIPDLSNASLFAFEADIAKNWWGTRVGIGADNNDDGKISASDNELAIAIRPSDHDDQLQLLLADGSTQTVAFPAANGNAWASFRVEIDLEANSGAGAVTVKYKDISAGDSEWITVSGLEDINAGLNPSASDHTNPDNWNGTFILGDGQGVNVDNLKLEAQSSQGTVILTEDTGVDGSSNLVQSGVIVVSDNDAGEDNFNAETQTGTYGSLTIDASGNWSYTASNSQTAIQSLTSDEQLSETFTVSSADGSTHDIVVTINGTNDAPELEPHVLVEEVIAAYSFDDTSDVTGNGNSLTLSGSATLGTGYGGSGSALEMDGTEGHANIAGIETGGAMSVSTWVKIDSFDQESSRIFDFGNGQADDNIFLGHSATTNDLSFHIYSGSGSQGDAELNISDFFTAGEWVHVTATVGSDGTMSIYKNGELAGQVAGVVPATMVRTNNYIGKSNWDGDGSLDGSVDDFAIYNKELSANEIKAIYQASSVENQLNDAFYVDELSVVSTIGSVSASDVENDSLTYSLTNDAGGRFSINASTGDIAIADASLRDHEANASHTITVQVSDGALSSTRDYTIYVTNTDEAPVAADNTLTTNEDVGYSLTTADLGYSDPESVVLSAIEITSLPGSGALNLDGSAVTLNQQISKADIEAGNLVFIPAANEAGDDYASIGFKVSDGALWSDQSYTLTVDVNAVADKAILEVDALIAITNEQLFSTEFTSRNMDGWSGTNFNFYSLGGNPSHRLDSGQTISRTIDTSNGEDFVLDLRVYGSHDTNDSTQLEVIWDGNVVATLNPVDTWSSGAHNQTVNLSASGSDSATLSLRTVNGGSTYLDNIRVYEELPNLIVDEDISGSIDLSLALTDTDSSETLALSVSGLPEGAVITDGSNSATSTGADIDLTGWNTDTLSMTPAADDHNDFNLVFTATTTESSNSDAETAQKTIVVTVNPVMDAPVSIDNALLLRQGDRYSFKQRDFSFSDGDDGDTLQSITVTALPALGSLTLNGVAVTASQVISAADIPNLAYNAPASGGDLSNSFTFTISDGSLSSDPQTFELNVRGFNSETVNGSSLNEIIYGGIGTDTIDAGAGDDTIIGGAGNDILTGGHDSDTFVWHASDVGTAEAPSVDLLTDFHVGQGGDILDLSDVLVEEENHQLDEYLHFNFSGGDTTLEISTQANGDVTQKVTLQGVDLSSLGGSDSEIINNLLNDGNLQVDQ